MAENRRLQFAEPSRIAAMIARSREAPIIDEAYPVDAPRVKYEAQFVDGNSTQPRTVFLLKENGGTGVRKINPSQEARALNEQFEESCR